MIYLKNIEDVQRLLIPKGRENIAPDVVLNLFSTIYQSDLTINVQDWKVLSLYYWIEFNIPDIEPGEYEYSFKDALGELSSGVLVVGEKARFMEYSVEHEQSQYEIPYEYEQYGSHPEWYIDVPEGVIWLLPDDYATDVLVRANVSWEIE